MMASPNDPPLTTIAIFGATGLVGKAVCNEAQRIGYRVIGISRTKSESCLESMEVDFLNYEQLAQNTQELVTRQNPPDAFVFCHRSRVAAHLSEAEALLQSTAIDIYPYLALKEALKKTGRNGTLNIVTVTSNAAFGFAHDVKYNYHITKHAQVAASIGLSSVPSTLDIFSNVITFGEAIDNSKEDHDQYHIRLFAALSRFTSGRPVPSIVNVARVALLLCKASSLGICGQTIAIDSGLNSITQESMLRLLSN